MTQARAKDHSTENQVNLALLDSLRITATVDRQLKADLTGPMKKPDSSGTIYLEGKKEMKSRGLASPDAADALAVTFAFPVASRESSFDRAARTSPRGHQQTVAATGWMGN